MRDVAFRRRTDLMSQSLPSDPPYLLLEHPAAALSFAADGVQAWAEQARAEAELLIGIVRDDVAGGQRQWFGRSDNFGKSGQKREVAEGLFALLAAGDGQARVPVRDDESNVISPGLAGVVLDAEVDVGKSPLFICDPHSAEGPDLVNDARSIMTTNRVIAVRVGDGSVRVVAQGERAARPDGVLLHQQQLELSQGELSVGSPLQQDEHTLDFGDIRSTHISIYGDKSEFPSLVWIMVERI